MNVATKTMTALAAVTLVASLPASASETRVNQPNPAARLALSAQGAGHVPQYRGNDCVKAADEKWYWHNPENDKWYECGKDAAGGRGTNIGLIIAGIAIAGGLGLGLGLSGGGGGPASP